MAVEWEQAHEDPREGGRRRRRSITSARRGAPELENPEVLVQHDDGVAWLVVLGNGVWGYGHGTGEVKVDRAGRETPVVEMRNFPAGIHWVDQETVDFARKARVPYLVVTTTMPDVVRRRIEGPLSPAHLHGVSDDALVLRPEAEATVADEPEEGSAPLDFPCGYCDRRFPSSAARGLHVEFDHEQQVQIELDAEASEPEPEPALTDA